MWDYDKLFANENIVGISYPDGEIVPFPVKFQKESNRENLIKYYGNEKLSNDEHKIQYIICLDEHGNVVEKLFDRDKDFMPILKDGIFVKFTLNDDCFYPIVKGIIVKNKIVSKDGTWCKLSDIDSGRCKIVCIYSDTVNCFDECEPSNIIWIDSEYKTRYNIKLNK